MVSHIIQKRGNNSDYPVYTQPCYSALLSGCHPCYYPAVIFVIRPYPCYPTVIFVIRLLSLLLVVNLVIRLSSLLSCYPVHRFPGSYYPRGNNACYPVYTKTCYPAVILVIRLLSSCNPLLSGCYPLISCCDP